MIFFVVLVLGIQKIHAQESFDIHNWIKNQQEMLQNYPDEVYANSQLLEKDAKRSKSNFTELVAVDMQCVYFKVKNDFDKMLLTAKYLESKAIEYENFTFQILAKKHLFEALAFTGLVEDGFIKLQEAEKLLNHLNDSDEFQLMTKSDIYVAISNYYFLIEDYDNQLKYIKIAGLYFNKIPTAELRSRLQYIHNSNLAGVYFHLNKMDSAKFFAEKSLFLEKDYNRRDIQTNNFIILGNLALLNSQPQSALVHFQKAELITGYKNHLNTEVLFKKIIETYQKLGNKNGVELYQTKLDSLQLIIARNQNKSLQSILKENNSRSKEDLNPLLFWGIGSIVLVGIVFLIFIKTRKKIHTNDFTDDIKDGDYTQLFDLVKINDPSFLTIFNQKFKNFNEKLLEINPSLSHSELEICAMIKLKIPTKYIAQYKFISPKTVQNKKHLIRKKLNIDSEIDLYNWFETF